MSLIIIRINAVVIIIQLEFFHQIRYLRILFHNPVHKRLWEIETSVF